ncbi:Hypothetical_protein [Hexamita inflata]|uniref:Hypothetical_protein n=1 Tax=Hexamita inflata TaxID=28002 RepID=A0AA86N9A3_9EUKA|nr:Hypothetical protein HINF_LOCUS3087 [Hexamita inflata]
MKDAARNEKRNRMNPSSITLNKAGISAMPLQLQRRNAKPNRSMVCIYYFLVVQFNNNVKINHYFIFCFSLSIALGVIIVENNLELHSIDGRSRVISIAYFIMNNILQTY